MVAICLLNELSDFAFVYIPDREYIVNVPFPGEWINIENAYKIFCTTLQNLEICRILTTHNCSTLYP